eukprot:tig00000823_g4558.t1
MGSDGYAKGAAHNDAHAQRNAILSCFLYSFCSMCMVYVNKVVLSIYSFHFHFALLFIQNAIAVLLVSIAKQAGIITYADFDAGTARRWLPVNFFFVAMLLTGTYSLRYLSVPMMTVFKNLTNIPICFGDRVLYGQTVSSGIILSLVLMIISAVVGAYTDSQFSALGYFWMLGNCAATAAYVLYMRTAMRKTQLGEFGMMFYNNLISIPLITVLVFLFDEAPGVFREPLLSNTGFLVVVFISGSIGFALSLSSFWCMKKTSPTTYSITGSLNKIPLAGLGILLFDTPVTLTNVLSIVIGLGGGVLYSLEKQKLAQRAAAKPREDTPQDLEKGSPEPDSDRENGPSRPAPLLSKTGKDI